METKVEIKEKRTNKKAQVLEWLFKHGSITSLEAIQHFKATRLTDIIFRLRKEHCIVTGRTEGGQSC